jgi:Uncharacterised nucleotidyltransferase
LDTLDEIRETAAVLAAGLPLAAGACRHWTKNHLSLVLYHGLGPWLYKSLRDNPQADLSPDILQSLRQEYRGSAVAGMARDVCLLKLLNAFNSREIPVMLLKGAYLGRFVYEDPALRPMEDVDILVREEDLFRARQELTALGYDFVVAADFEYHQYLQMPETYSRPGNPFDIIDLHSAVRSMDYYLFSSAFLWKEAIEEDLKGRKVFYLSPEMNFVHLAVHNLNHVGLLRDWIDIILLLRNGNSDWERLLCCARSVGALRPLFWIFQELENTWNWKPPAVVNSELSRYKPHWLEDRVIRHRFRYLWRLYSRIASFTDWNTKLKYVFLKLFPCSRRGADSTGTVERFTHLRQKLGLFFHFWTRY